MYWYRRLPHWVPENSTVFVTWRVVVCRKQNSEYALDCGAANPGCRRLSAGADRLTIGPQDTILPHQTPAAKTAGATSWSLRSLKMYKLQPPAFSRRLQGSKTRVVRKSRLKGGCRQDWLPRKAA